MPKFKPRLEVNEVICIRIKSEKLDLVDHLAAKNNMSRNKFIIQCVDFAIENLDMKEN